MTREEAKEVFINRGYINVKGGTIFDGDKWRQSVAVITEWLKEQPCEDAISRQAALDEISRIGLCKCNINEVIAVSECLTAVEDLPSVRTEKTGRWIPVSERLPDIHNCFQECLITNKHKSVYKAFFTDINGKQLWSVDDVIAWMPLPQPYKAESEE